ncbi:predicted protein [Pyrenophora tritici-repentis Pt-1C-BFP]|uniref:Uncharacterized protein n=1 Tax=Pyrenophora tritici-repentis (strain Pt-1C-BFP) TaxID=426418 RepID=B2WEF1_PYRTR|nr:uncharacterized protein PTRG_08524 [Pyrenophora tritici-repentis Pt-1C-BFP]EDU51443.1 predicted protein [Pyrenophora tritici-repentis Pt-1C-BFP]
MQVEDEMWKFVLPVRVLALALARCVIPSRSLLVLEALGARICPTPSTPNLPIPAAIAKHGSSVVHMGEASCARLHSYSLRGADDFVPAHRSGLLGNPFLTMTASLV